MRTCFAIVMIALTAGTGSVELPAATSQVVQPPVKPPAPGSGNVTHPRRVASVDPVLPEEMQRQCASGLVVLQAIIGPDGAVKEVRGLSGIRGLQDAAAVAVRQWRYTPPLLNGVAVSVVNTVTVTFGPRPCLKALPESLAQVFGEKPSPAEASQVQAVRAWLADSGSTGVPVSGPLPVYPPIALAARIQGLVILDCVVGADGKPGAITVVRPAPLLDQAAIEAVKASMFPPSQSSRTVRIAADFR